MKNILIHGLGQNNSSWNETSILLKNNNIDVICPGLFDITNGNKKDYENICNAFSDFCNSQEEKLNLCGLSLGGILVLDYVKKFPEKVNSIVIIGTPFKIPKVLFKIQSFIFRLMPKSKFVDIGCTKKDFITLVNSMNVLDIEKNLNDINCKTLILCGDKDNVNMKSSKLIHKNIKGSNFQTVNRASHEVNVDNPKELATIIYHFWGNEQ